MIDFENTTWFHGSPYLFDTFDYDRIGTNGKSEGVGFYFTNNLKIAKQYATNGYLYKARLKTNPSRGLSDNEKKMTREECKRLLEALHDRIELLWDYGDISWEGYEKVLENAVQLVYETANTDSELIASLYNGAGYNEKILHTVKDVLNYDHLISQADWGNQTLCIVMDKDIIDIQAIEQIQGERRT